MTNEQIQDAAKSEALCAINSLCSALTLAETIKDSQEFARKEVSECDDIAGLQFIAKSFKFNAETLIERLQSAIRFIDQASGNIEALAARNN